MSGSQTPTFPFLFVYPLQLQPELGLGTQIQASKLVPGLACVPLFFWRKPGRFKVWRDLVPKR